MYECPRCEHRFDTITNLRRHLSKKNTCNPILNDIKIEDIDLEKCKQDVCLYSCQECNKVFTMKSSLNRHKIKCIKEDENSLEYLKKIVDKLNEQLQEKDKTYKEQIQEKDKQINELIKKAGNTFNTINILYSATNPKLDHLTDNDMYACVNSCMLSVPNLVKNIHFNPKVPENHNIYITNFKNNYIMVFNGKQWEIKDREEIIENMININEFRLEDWVSNEEVQKMYPKAMKKFEQYMKKREEDGAIDKIKNEIKMLLYNKKDMIIETRNKTKILTN